MGKSRTITCILEVDEDLLKKANQECEDLSFAALFEREMGWVSTSGITLKSWSPFHEKQ